MIKVLGVIFSIITVYTYGQIFGFEGREFEGNRGTVNTNVMVLFWIAGAWILAALIVSKFTDRSDKE